MLLHNRQALELFRDNIQRIHRATASADILDLICLLATVLPFSLCSWTPHTSNLSGFNAFLSLLNTLSSFSSR
jgi:hypothetical protein